MKSTSHRTSGGTHRVIFTTIVDISQCGGNSIATREVISALLRHEEVDPLIFCPYPEENTEIFQANSTKFNFIPMRADDPSLVWHLITQVRLFNLMYNEINTDDCDIIISRAASSLIAPAIMSHVESIDYYNLFRGHIARDIQNRAYSALVRINLLINMVLSERTMVAFKELTDEIPLSRLYTEKMRISQNGVNPDKFVPTEKQKARQIIHGIPSGSDMIIGFVGSISRRHKIKPLLKSIASLRSENKGISLILVGESQMDSELKQMCQELKIDDHVQFIGHVEHDNVSKYINACDLMYGVVDPNYPSNPIKIYEYLSCNRPILSTSRDDLQFIEEQGFGYLLSEPTEENITRVLREHIQRCENELIQKDMREYIISNHTWKSTIDDIISDVQH